MTRSGARHNAPGFTLIELLVVVSIVAILTTILIPVLAQARGKARQLSCINNEKQNGFAFLLYAQDYDGACVLGHNKYFRSSSLYEPDTLWYTDFLQPYLSTDPANWICPDLAGAQYLYRRNSYGYNVFALGDPTDRTDRFRQVGYRGVATEAAIRRPTQTVVFSDIRKSSAGAMFLYPWWIGRYPADDGNDGLPGDHHNRGCNLLLFDGHIKFFLREALNASWPEVGTAGADERSNSLWTRE